MNLIGQYDSPFVRRVAVTMNLYELPFERRVLSVFTDFAAVLALNPLGKVPVLELDDGEHLFDSRAILDYLDGLMPPQRRLLPADEPHRRRVLRIEAVAVGLAEKLYERGYELARRDPAKRDPAVLDRVEHQIASALAWLAAVRPAPWFYGTHISRADLTSAIAVSYLREKHAPLLARTPSVLLAHCEHCEALDAFARAAYSAAEAQASGWVPERDPRPSTVG
ncbi:MAG TPA: glutathione S-transferase family protein [Acetobacteraceae bacterium]|nr:glutathione S-transferase family protein [Acetobacteraceae bacterium]